MFNLQGSEIIVILLLALVVLGPEKLPDAIRKFSQTYGELKKMGTGFQTELKSALDEPLNEMKETARLVQDAADPQKLMEQADAEDNALREAAKAAEQQDRPDVPIAAGAVAVTDPSYSGEPDADAGHASEAEASEPVADADADVAGDEAPVVINQIAAGNARGPIEPPPPPPTAPGQPSESASEVAEQSATSDSLHDEAEQAAEADSADVAAG